MHKIGLIFFYFLVAEWQSLAVRRFNTDPERAIAELTRDDRKYWDYELDTQDLDYMCYELILFAEKIEKFHSQVDIYRLNVTSVYVGEVNVEVKILECRSTENYDYIFTGGVNRTYVRIEGIRVNNTIKYIPFKHINTYVSYEWDYIHAMDGPQDNRIAFCQEILAQHHPQEQYRIVQALRALRFGYDKDYKYPRLFMTLLCYYDWNNGYFEYCEGDNDNEVYPVMPHSRGEYMPVRTLPIHVYCTH